MVLSISAARELVKHYEPQWRQNHHDIDRLDRWMRTDYDRQDLPDLPSTSTQEYRELRDRSPTPWLKLVVTAVAQSLYVEGYRRPRDPEDAAGWEAWQANGLDARQISVHRGALGHGLSYATVLPGTVRGEPMPSIRGVSARSMVAFYQDVADDDWPMYALRGDVAHGPDGKQLVRFRLYDESAVYTVDVRDSSDQVMFITHDEHRAGVCPVVRFANELDLDGRSTGEVEPFIPIAARIDQDTFDRLVVQRFGAWKVRTVAGMEQPDTPAEQRAAALALRIEDLLVSDSPDTKFGTLDETPLSGYIEARNADIKDLAAVSQTPPHALTGQMVNLSAEALAAAEAGLHRKVVERQHLFGESWEQALRLAQHLRGDTDGAAAFDAQVRWADTESRSLASAADALGKLAEMLSVPVELLWEKIPGFTDQDVKRAIDLRSDGDILSQLGDLLDKQMVDPTADPEPAPV